MEKLGFLDQETKKNKVDIGCRIFVAALLSLGFFSWFLTMFSIKWSVRSMFSGGFSGGLVNVWNRICDTLGSSQYIIISKFNGAALEAGLFISVCFVLITLLNYVILGSKKSWPLIIYVVPFLVLSIIFELRVDTISFMTFCIAIMVTLAYVKNGYRILGGTAILMVALAVICGFASNTAIFGKYVNNAEAVHNLRTDANLVINRAYYGANPLKNGDLKETKRDNGKGTALEVKMSKPQSMYLKGFTGSIVSGGRWQDVPNGYYYGNYPLVYDLDKNGFNGVGQIAQTASIVNKNIGENKIDVKAKKASKEFAYVPYDITNLGALDKYQLKGDNQVFGGKAGKFKEYSYTASDNQVEKWTDIAGALFSEEPKTKEMQKAKAAYLENESYYNKFVYETYTYLDASDKSAAADALGKYVPRKDGHEDYKVAIEKIKKYLADDFVYSDRNNADNFTAQRIIESKSGYDMQYATAAVVMFRYYGIPARYVEGFLITPEDVKNVKPGETLEVPMSRAHCWPEIYIDGVGFVPIEVCPKYEGMMKEADLSIGISNSKRSSNSVQPPNKLEQMIIENELESDGSSSLNLWFILMIAAIGAIAISLLYKLIRLIVGAIAARQALKKLFYKEEPKVAVSGIYGQMCELGYPINEFVRKNGNKAAYSREPIDEDVRQKMIEEYKKSKVEYGQAEKERKKRLKKSRKQGKVVKGDEGI